MARIGPQLERRMPWEEPRMRLRGRERDSTTGPTKEAKYDVPQVDGSFGDRGPDGPFRLQQQRDRSGVAHSQGPAPGSPSAPGDGPRLLERLPCGVDHQPER